MIPLALHRQGPGPARLPARNGRRPPRVRWAAITLAAGLLVALPWAAARAAMASPPVADGDVATANAAAVRAAFDAWAAGTGDVFDLLHEDVVWTVAGHSPVSATYSSRGAFMAGAVTPITAKLATPIQPRLRSLVAQGDTVVAVWDGVATTHAGHPYRNSYAWHMVLAEGRIVRVMAFLDTWALQALMQE